MSQWVIRKSRERVRDVFWGTARSGHIDGKSNAFSAALFLFVFFNSQERVAFPEWLQLLHAKTANAIFKVAASPHSLLLHKRPPSSIEKLKKWKQLPSAPETSWTWTRKLVKKHPKRWVVMYKIFNSRTNIKKIPQVILRWVSAPDIRGMRKQTS